MIAFIATQIDSAQGFVFATRAMIEGLHRRDNVYRFDRERGTWMFYDGVGPWAPSGNLSKLDEAQGIDSLSAQGFAAIPQQGPIASRLVLPPTESGRQPEG